MIYIYKYWKIDRIKSYDRLFNFVIGGRGIGKTYACKREGIKQYLATGEQFIYLRRYKEEIKPLKNGKFFEAIANEYEEYEFRTNGELLQLRAGVPEGEKNENKWETCGYLINLSTALTKKSVDYANVNMIIYDEFIIPKGFIRYLPNEVESFLDFYETVARTRNNVKVYFLSNAISAYNPYFIYFKLQAPKEGSFYKTKEIVVEMCANKEFAEEKKQSRFGQIIEGTKYAAYAIDNEFYLDDAKFIAKKPGTARYFCTIIYKSESIGIWVDYKDGKWYACKNVDKSCKLSYALTTSDHDINTLYTAITKPAQLKAVAKAYALGVLFFESQEIKGYMGEIMELIK